jgi:hypothetical protein
LVIAETGGLSASAPLARWTPATAKAEHSKILSEAHFAMDCVFIVNPRYSVLGFRLRQVGNRKPARTPFGRDGASRITDKAEQSLLDIA